MAKAFSGRFNCIPLCIASSAKADSPSPATSRSLFDPAKHMRVSEVRPGMKGYGRFGFLWNRARKI